MGLAGIGWARPGNERQAWQGALRCGGVWQGRHGAFGPSVVERGMVKHGRHF